MSERNRIDANKPLPSNLETYKTDRLIEVLQQLGGQPKKDSTREDIINSIRTLHNQKWSQKIKENERKSRSAIPRVVRKNWAQKRLMKDLQEIQSNKLDFVCALPLRNNIFEWHVNLLAPKSCKYFPMVLHLILRFPPDYPLKPPNAKLLTPLHHSHVYNRGDWICLDLLETHHSSQSYFGWSSAYSVMSILYQLQSFLFEEQDQYSDNTIKSDIRKSYQIRKCVCGHLPSSGKYWPTWNYWKNDSDMEKTYFIQFNEKKVFRRGGELKFSEFKNNSLIINEKTGKFRTFAEQERRRRYRKNRRRRTKELRNLRKDSPELFNEITKIRKDEILKIEKRREKRKEQVKEKLNERKQLWSILPNEIFIKIFEFCDAKELFRFSKVSKDWRKISQHPFLWKDELKCFHTRMDFREGCLGLGINVQKRYGKIHSMSTTNDVISKHAFKTEKIQKSPWKEPFTHWMPLFIDTQHWRKCEQDFEDLVVEIYGGEGEFKFKPHLGVDMLCRLMTSMIIEIMKGDVHGSLKAVQGYSYFFRILIYYVLKFPKLRNEVDYNIGMFIKGEKYRHKVHIPNLGDFISLLSVSQIYDWEDIKDSFIREVFDRNSFWIRRKKEMVIEEEKKKKEKNRFYSQKKGELEISFECVKVSLRFSLFHLCFLRRFRSMCNSIDILAQKYDRRYGKEESRIMDAIQMDIFEVSNNINNFQDFFKFANISVGNSKNEESMILKKLKDSEWNFRRRGYNRRINTSGCLLTGKFRRNKDELKELLGLAVKSNKKRIIQEEEEEEEEEIKKNKKVKKKQKKRNPRRLINYYHVQNYSSYNNYNNGRSFNYYSGNRNNSYYGGRNYSYRDFESNQKFGYGKKRKKSNNRNSNSEVVQQHRR